MANTPDDRRQFLRAALTTVGVSLCAGTVGSLITSCETDETLPTVPSGKVVRFSIASIPELAAPGGIAQVNIPGVNFDTDVFIVRLSTSSFVVFSILCQHQFCPLPAPERVESGTRLVCPCHAAEYDATNGRILKQPLGGSSRDLPSFQATFEADSQTLVIAV